MCTKQAKIPTFKRGDRIFLENVSITRKQCKKEQVDLLQNSDSYAMKISFTNAQEPLVKRLLGQNIHKFSR